MRPNLLAVPHYENDSFDIRHERLAYFTNPWHFHPELELNYVVSGAGTRFIGQSVERFESGEIILLGKNLPHFWKSDQAYIDAPTDAASEAIVVRFPASFAGELFFDLPETKHINNLFSKAAYGLKLSGPLCSVIASSLVQLVTKKGFDKLISLIMLLHTIAESGAYETISPNYVPALALLKTNERMSRVVAYLIDHFTEPVLLQTVAALANMNEAAFCRYFRTQTGQTMHQYIADLRIRYACELLSKSRETVTQVGYQVGFGNLSHFIHAFKKARLQTPFAFRKQQRGIKTA